MSRDEGYIKFQNDHQFEKIDAPDGIFREISVWRTKLFDLGMIGETPEGIGYGNISFRYGNNFIITGSATGKKRILEVSGYALVRSYDYEMNKVQSSGMTRASSESLSHAAVYECHTNVNSVIHVHHEKMWKWYLNDLPTTSEKFAFGTPEMAYDIQRIIKDKAMGSQGILIMGGHQDGIITFGKSVETAAGILLSHYNSMG